VRQQAEHLGLTTGELVFGGKAGFSRQLVSAAASFFAFSSLVVTDGVPQSVSAPAAAKAPAAPKPVRIVGRNPSPDIT
jgi:hypothetical protein